MNAARVQELIEEGAGINLEFKAAKNSLPQSVYETVYSFLNREGGHIFLGVEDDGSISGVNPKSIPQMLDSLTKNINNPDILDPTFYLGSNTVEIDGKSVVVIYVPASSQAHRHKGKIYDRGGDGDFKITNNKSISALYVRKQESYTENRVFPYLEIDDFEEEMLSMARKMLGLNRADHPWARMTHEEMLMAAHMRLKDQQTGKVGYTLAAIPKNTLTH